MYAIVETGGSSIGSNTGLSFKLNVFLGDVGGRVELRTYGWFMATKASSSDSRWSKAQRSRRRSSTRAGLDRSWSSRNNGGRTIDARRAIVRVSRNCGSRVSKQLKQGQLWRRISGRFI